MNRTLLTTLYLFIFFSVTIREVDCVASAMSLIFEHVTYGNLVLFEYLLYAKFCVRTIVTYKGAVDLMCYQRRQIFHN